MYDIIIKMRFHIKTIFSKHFIPILIVVFVGILAARSLLFQSGYFMMHDDLQMMRQLQMEKCILDGQIPCRWVPDMANSYGYPLFNFYPPLPYLIGEGIRVIGFSFVDTAKLLFAFSIIGSGIAMYFLAKEFFGRIGGILSAIFYIWAPYHAVDVYVRGAMNESWALVWFPLIFLFSYKLITVNRQLITKNIIFLSLFYSLLFLSHNLMVLIFTPIFTGWVILFLWLKKAWSQLPLLILAGLWSLGLAAFFTIPAILENNLTHLQSQLQGYFEYSAHFVTMNQLFISRFWGYQGSAWGIENDGMSFAIGHLHWILSLLILVAALIKLIKAISKNELRKHPIVFSVLFMIAVGWLAAFMTHSRSTFIYLALPFLQYVQFPWRFLTIVIFSLSFCIGVIPGVFADLKSGRGLLFKFLATPPQLLITLLLALCIILFNWNYFKPMEGKMGPLTDEEKFSGVAWELQQAGGVWDYLPKSAVRNPLDFKKSVADVVTGQATLLGATQGTYWIQFDVDAKSDSTIRLNTISFPQWKVSSKNRSIDYYIADDEMWGRMYIDLPAGQHTIYAQLYNTLPRTIANIISLLAWSLLIYFGVVSTIRKARLPSG